MTKTYNAAGKARKTDCYSVYYATKRTSKKMELIVKAGQEPTMEMVKSFDKNAIEVYSIRYIRWSTDYSSQLALNNID